MYPVLKMMHMLNFLDTFSIGVTPLIMSTKINKFVEAAPNVHYLHPSLSIVNKSEQRCKCYFLKNITSLQHFASENDTIARINIPDRPGCSHLDHIFNLVTLIPLYPIITIMLKMIQPNQIRTS